MDNIRSTIDTLFSQINSSAVLDCLLANKQADATLGITEEMFCQKFMVKNKCYTPDQVHELYYLLMSEWMKIPLLHLQEEKTGKSLFYILSHYTLAVLTEIDKKPVCKYAELLRWRSSTYQLGEDLFTTSYLAFNDAQLMNKRNIFYWPAVIAQDNAAIDYILRKGVTDLHFHLRGSSLNYELNWISLMNNIQHRKSDFNQLRKCLSYKTSTMDEEKWDSFYLSTIKACAIRCYFFLTLTDEIQANDFKHILSQILHCDNDILIQKTKYNGIDKSTDTLQQYIENMKYLCKYKKCIKGKYRCIDYAIPHTPLDNTYNANETEIILSGERYLLYNIFHRIYSEKLSYKEESLFYIYLLQKEQLRKELVQLNELKGFANFSDYEQRKELFIRNQSEYQYILPQLAIDMAFASGYLKYLECRITPRNTSEDLYKSINLLEEQIEKRNLTTTATEKGKGKKTFYYILHFIKKEDNKGNSLISNKFSPVQCRHFQLRHEIKIQGMATLEALKKYPDLRERIIGIDSANTELFCRPEVFGPIYRYMKHFCNHHPDNKISPLKFTYHVGEDFWDITDGLRAIDEAILFLNLNASDRLGHALALGTNVDDYYRKQNYWIVMSKQSIMDNAMWLLQKARELKISLSNNVFLQLQEIFNHFYQEIYLNSQAKRFAECLEGAENEKNLESGKDIYLYYQSWLLRGDDPEYYKNEKNKATRNNYYAPWDITAYNRYNDKIIHAQKQEIAFLLYKNYHYNPYIRQVGNERYELKLNTEIISLIKQVQHKMCHQIASLHLGIEANISSNLAIGSMNKYMHHPIVKLYQLGLSMYEAENCPQMSVSINTDDRGIFETSIEAEYALLSLALEKEKDKNNQPRYQPRYIYEWLNNLRKMGFEQQFKKQDASKY